MLLSLAILLALPAAAFAAPPAVTLTSPGTGAVAGLVPIRATASDDGTVDRVELTIRGAKLVDTDAPYGGNFDTTAVNDGPAIVRATAFDDAGESSFEQVDVLIDNTAPTLHVTGPDKQAFAPGSTQAWTLAASDAGSGIAQIRCSVVLFAQQPAFGLCSGPAAHGVTGLAEGRYTFTVRATDAAGNAEEATRGFRIETPAAPVPAAPTVTPQPTPAPVAAAVTATVAPKAAPPQIFVALAFSFTSTTKATKLSDFVVRNVPAGSTITVRCPKGCAKKVLIKKTVKGGKLTLKPLVKKPLKVHTTITVTVSKPGASSAVKVLKIRARRAPLVTTKCQPEGAKPVTC